MNAPAIPTDLAPAVARPLPPIVQVLARAGRGRRARAGLALVAIVVAIAVIGPFVAPHAPDAVVGAPFNDPTASAPLGTDYLGHDVLSRVLWGGRSVLWMSLAATALCMVIGVTLGLVAGYARNRVDGLIMRVLDVVLAFPPILLVLLFVSLMGTKLWLVTGLVAVAYAPQVARVARGATLEVIGREFIESAEVLGVTRRRMLMGEVIPNVVSPLMVECGLRLTWAIGLVAAVSFLGFGIQPPNADWGLMINENRIGLTVQPLAVIGPILCIAALTFGTNLITEGIARTVTGIDRGRGRE